MRSPTHATPSRAPLHRGVGPISGFVEWDDTPSFAGSLHERLQWKQTGGASLVADTVPGELMPATPASSPFREPVEGLSVREVHDADLFRHFFGATAGR